MKRLCYGLLASGVLAWSVGCDENSGGPEAPPAEPGSEQMGQPPEFPPPAQDAFSDPQQPAEPSPPGDSGAATSSDAPAVGAAEVATALPELASDSGEAPAAADPVPAFTGNNTDPLELPREDSDVALPQNLNSEESKDGFPSSGLANELGDVNFDE